MNVCCNKLEDSLSTAGSLSDVRIIEDEGRKGEGELRREESFIQ